MSTSLFEPQSCDVKIIKEEGFYAKYVPKDTLGFGVTSVVRRCVCQSTLKEYAVKIIEKIPVKEHEVRAEIHALSLLYGYPNIIGLIDTFENESHFFLVFELAEGGELFDYLTKMITIPEKIARTMLYEIIGVVSHMHKHGIVHRDLKPENILLSKDNHILLSDFGFAVQLNSNEKLKELCGTPDYLAPEVLKCSIDGTHPGYGLEVDMWACGVIAYMLLVGFSPFWHRKQNIMLWNIMDGKYSLGGSEWKDISDSPKDLISKLLVVDPAKRLTADMALLHPWFGCISGVMKPRIKLRLKFRTIVKAILTIKSLYSMIVKKGVALSISAVLLNPYSDRHIRRVIDACAFNIYGHWIKRSNIQRQNRNALFENKPKSDLCDEEICVIDKPIQYRLAFSNPLRQYHRGNFQVKTT